MSDIRTRKEGCAGRITLTRPAALNALSHEMSLVVETALDDWREDPGVALVLLDAEGDRAFCAGGDLEALYRTGMAGDFETGRAFWRDEYRMNAKISEYSKPVVSFLHGFVMGGGVGLGAHCSHRIIGESTQLAMPECSIGFVPDVGGSLLLARAPGRLGEYLGLTATRMGPGDAIYAGFADHYVPEADWPGLKQRMCDTGDVSVLEEAATVPPDSPLAAAQRVIDALFAADALAEILAGLEAADGDLASSARRSLTRNSPLAMAITLEALRRLRVDGADIRSALRQDYRFAHRAAEQGDFLEGIRAQIIDKDRNPQWQYAGVDVPMAAIAKMLMPLGEHAVKLEGAEG